MDFDFARLSNDLLSFILALVPPRPRLLVVSRVCRRWRRLALRTITSYKNLRYASDLPRAIGLLSSLTKLSFQAANIRNAPVVYPNSLFSLKVAWMAEEDRRSFQNISSLTSLKVLHPGFYPEALIQANGVSLTSLELKACRDFFLSYPVSLLPSLTHLGILDWSYLKLSNLVPLINRHAEQLQSFSFSCNRFEFDKPHLKDVHVLSSLRVFTFKGHPMYYSHIKHAVPAACREIICLSGERWLSFQSEKIIAAIPRASLTAINTDRKARDSDLHALIVSCSHLTRVSYIASHPSAASAVVAQQSSLRRLKLVVTEVYEKDGEKVRAATAEAFLRPLSATLTELSLCNVSVLPTGTLTFPNLRYFSVQLREDNHLSAWTAVIFTACPGLRRLKIRFSSLDPGKSLSAKIIAEFRTLLQTSRPCALAFIDIDLRNHALGNRAPMPGDGLVSELKREEPWLELRNGEWPAIKH